MEHELILHNPARLATLRRLKLLDSPAEYAFDRMTQLLSKITHVPVSLISLIDEDRQFFKSLVGMAEPWASARQTPLSHSFCQYVVSSGEPLVVEDARENPMLRDNLAICDMDVIAYAGFPISAPNGQILGSCCIIDSKPRKWTADELDLLRDITASVMVEIELRNTVLNLKESEQQISDYAAQLEMVNQELELYAGTTAHDLKSPLNAILGYTELIQVDFGEQLPEQALNYLEHIAHSGVKMSNMITHLLTLASLQNVSQSAVPFEVAPIIDGALSRVRDQLERYGIAVVVAPDLPVAIGHSAWIEEVFANLISNAIKYMGKNNAAPRIEIRGFTHHAAESKMARYEVCDTGVGIAAKDQTRLFHAFVRAHQEEADGLGLGLSIVKRIVTRSGGEVGLESELGHGSTFWFTLPVPPSTPDPG